VLIGHSLVIYLLRPVEPIACVIFLLVVVDMLKYIVRDGHVTIDAAISVLAST